MLLKARAFTLIELLIVLAIIVILASIGIPTYNDYLVKARIAELLSVGDSYKLRLVDNLFQNEASNNTVYNLNTNLIDYVTVATLNTNPPKYIIEVVAKMKDHTHSGIGLAKPASSHRNLTIQLQGVDNGDVISWTCHAEATYHKYVTKSCQNGNLEQVTTR